MTTQTLTYTDDGNLPGVSLPSEASIRDLTFGPGRPASINTLEGAYGIPEVRTDDRNRPLADGARAGLDLLGPRTIRGSIGLRDGMGPSIGEIADELVAAWSVSRDTLLPFVRWRRGDAGPRAIWVRPRRLEISEDRTWWRHGLALDVPFEAFAPDPRWYSLDVASVEITAPVEEGGREYPRTYPLTYGGGSSGLVTATNLGRTPVWPVVDLHGPMTNPTLRHTDLDLEVRLAITIAAGTFVRIHMGERTVMLSGTASRYGNLVGAPGWWPIMPGSTNRLALLVGTAGEAAYAHVRWRHAWTG